MYMRALVDMRTDHRTSIGENDNNDWIELERRKTQTDSDGKTRILFYVQVYTILVYVLIL